MAELLPLPDGLHFTPAMSARAMVGGRVRITEIDMSYAEREGRSKLRPGRDGLRFIAMSFCWVLAAIIAVTKVIESVLDPWALSSRRTRGRWTRVGGPRE